MVTENSTKGPKEQLLGEIEMVGAALLFSGQVCHLSAFKES